MPKCLPDYSTAAEKQKFAKQMMELYQQDSRVSKYINDQNEMVLPADDKHAALLKKEPDSNGSAHIMNSFFQQNQKLFQNLKQLTSCEEGQVDELWEKVDTSLNGINTSGTSLAALDSYTIEYGFRMADTPAGQFYSGLKETIQNVNDEIDYIKVERKQQKKLEEEEQKLNTANQDIEDKENEIAKNLKELGISIDQLQPELEKVKNELDNARNERRKLKTDFDLTTLSQKYTNDTFNYNKNIKELDSLKKKVMQQTEFLNLDSQGREVVKSQRDYQDYAEQMNENFPDWEEIISTCNEDEVQVEEYEKEIQLLKEGSSGQEVKKFIDDWNDLDDVEKALVTMDELQNDGDFDVWGMTRDQKESPDTLAQKYDRTQIQNLEKYQNAKELLIKNAVKHNNASEKELRDDFERMEMESNGDIDPCNVVLSSTGVYVKTLKMLKNRQDESKKNPDVRKYSDIADKMDEIKDRLDDCAKDRQKIEEAKAELEKKKAKWENNQKQYEETIIAMGKKAGMKLSQDSIEVNPAKNQGTVKQIQNLNSQNIYRAAELQKSIENEKDKIRKDGEYIKSHRDDKEKITDIQKKVKQINERHENLKSVNTKIKDVTGLIYKKNNTMALAAVDAAKVKTNGRKQQYERYFQESQKLLRADEKKDSEPFKQMMNQMEKVQGMLCGDTPGDKSKAIELLQQKAQAYLDAKEKQWRPFPSQQRIDRLQGARSLLEFCTNVQRHLQQDAMQTSTEKQQVSVEIGREAAKKELTKAMETRMGEIGKQNKNLNNTQKNPQATTQKKIGQSVLGGL